MLFIADEIPTELKQIVEFLNEQMSPAEVLALEIKQYVGTDQTNSDSKDFWSIFKNTD